MNFLVITSASTLKRGNVIVAYGPYVHEMNLWFSEVSNIIICSPVDFSHGALLTEPFLNQEIDVLPLPEFDIKDLRGILRTLFYLPRIIFRIVKAMSWADHIHFRAPCNVTLIALFLQILFPAKIKSAKYAGNWGTKKGQPWSYNLQKWLLSNTFLTRNIKVLVYGQWPNQSKNIVPFFTATYRNEDRIPVLKSYDKGMDLVFLGNLSNGKDPLLAIKVAEELKNFAKIKLHILGDGPLFNLLQEYTSTHNLFEEVIFHGNVPREVVKSILQNSHFLVFPSKSEGWPKAVAESMFWGCIPVTNPISCVPWMLANGARGILISRPEAQHIAQQILAVWNNPEEYSRKSDAAMEWSREFTIEKFHQGIKAVLYE